MVAASELGGRAEARPVSEAIATAFVRRAQALLKEDQLLKDADGIKPFSEAPIDFPPSYKFDVGTSTYDSSAKQRTPSWTDRVLWHGARVTATRYTSCAELVASDHKPVVATLSWLDGWLEVDQAAEK